jgi:plasmid stabilization system protein ParE
MIRRYVLAPEAAHDLVQIWRYIKKNASIEMADRVESVIREKIVYLAGRPGGGHWRKDLTDEPVKFFSVYSYLIVYRPETSPLQVVAILHGRRDVEELLKGSFLNKLNARLTPSKATILSIIFSFADPKSWSRERRDPGICQRQAIAGSFPAKAAGITISSGALAKCLSRRSSNSSSNSAKK